MRAFAVLALCLLATAHAACPFTGESHGDCPHANQVASIPETTHMGCTCKSPCSATLTFDKARCDWCKTEDGCGKKAVVGGYSWDYCQYNANNTYEAMSRDWKLNYLWDKVTADQKHGDYPNVLGILDEAITPSFDAHRDVMPEGRKKYIHGVGAVCKFEMTISENSTYTGLFKANQTITGLIRLGSATPVDLKSGITPGVGVKFLRTGRESANFVALRELTPLPNASYNFFETLLTNHIPAPVGKTKFLAKKFTQASGCVTQVGLSDITAYGPGGAKSPENNFPFQLWLRPQVKMSRDACDLDTFQSRLINAIKPGEPLYTVTTTDSPKSWHPQVLGTIIPTAECVNSAFGDASLFFKHQRIEDDWLLRKEWFKDIQPETQCGAEKVSMYPPGPCV